MPLTITYRAELLAVQVVGNGGDGAVTSIQTSRGDDAEIRTTTGGVPVGSLRAQAPTAVLAVMFQLLGIRRPHRCS